MKRRSHEAGTRSATCATSSVLGVDIEDVEEAGLTPPRGEALGYIPSFA